MPGALPRSKQGSPKSVTKPRQNPVLPACACALSLSALILVLLSSSGRKGERGNQGRRSGAGETGGALLSRSRAAVRHGSSPPASLQGAAAFEAPRWRPFHPTRGGGGWRAKQSRLDGRGGGGCSLPA